MGAIRKVTLTVTVLSREEDARHIDEYSLQDIHYAITEGEMIGSFEIASNEVVPVEDVTDELLAIGNDGLFFSEE